MRTNRCISHDRRPVRTPARSSFACVALVLASACTGDLGSEPGGPSVIPTVGGQSGQEGSCVLGPVSELRFDPADMQRAVLGRHETTLRWNESGKALGETRGRAGLQPATFEISARGEPELKLGCGGSAFLDVDVHMQLPESGLNVTFSAIAQAWGHGEEVFVSSTLDRAFQSTLRAQAKQLADDLGSAPALKDPEEYYFDLWLFRGAVGGHLIARNDRDFCGVATWPETYCDSHAVPLEPELALGDFELGRALAAMRDLGEQRLRWTDGRSTQVRFEVEQEPGGLCVGPYFQRSAEDTTDGTEIVVPVSIRATTSDGALDARLSGSLAFTLSAEHGWDGRVRMEADAFGTQAAFATGGVTLPLEAGDGQVLAVHFEAARASDGDGGLISVSVLSSDRLLTRAVGVQRGGEANPLTCSGPASVDEHLQGVIGADIEP
jgi:hypothetical protein